MPTGDCLALSFELRGLDPQLAEAACQDLGAFAVTFSDALDDAVLEPGVGEVRLWPATKLQALFSGDADPVTLSVRLADELEFDAERVEPQWLGARAWEREWLRDFHALRFGSRLWICPRHEQVRERGAVVVTLDPGLAFGTGTHPSTALCLEWLDANVPPEQQFGEAKLSSAHLPDWARAWQAVRTVSDRSGGEIKIPGRPWHFADQPAPDEGQLAARQGEHNAEILTELGFGTSQIGVLEACGALVQPGR